MKFTAVFFIIILLLTSCGPYEDDYVPRSPESQGRSAKRGVSFNFQLEDDLELLSQGISWSYNWGVSQSSLFDALVSEKDIDFCPMAWNGVNDIELRAYVNSHPDCKYLLAFNEPNLVDQANMTPQQAAEKWGDVKAIATELNLDIISPAVNYGTLEGYTDPIVWLDEFFSLVPLEDVEGIAIHCYMSSPTALRSYVERFKKYDKPIWLTEFCAWDGLSENNYSVEKQQEFMSDVLNYLESEPAIFRYAWFIPRGGSEEDFPYMYLLKNTSTAELTALGSIYLQLSSQDTSVYYVEQQIIEAEKYSSISFSESEGEVWGSGPKVRVTSEAPNESLELYNFLPGQWVEYQILADRSRDFSIELRYACFVDSEVSIEIDGQQETSLLLDNTSKEYIWRTAKTSLPIDGGKHTIRITLSKGMICMNWLQFY